MMRGVILVCRKTLASYPERFRRGSPVRGSFMSAALAAEIFDAVGQGPFGGRG